MCLKGKEDQGNRYSCIKMLFGDAENDLTLHPDAFAA